jgi:hypothetical protein
MLVFRRLGNARAGARTDGVPAQHGSDDGRDRRRAAGPDLAAFRAVAVSDLSVAATAEADRRQLNATEERWRRPREVGAHDRGCCE